MKSDSIQILPYSADHQKEIQEMMDEIAEEFAEPITTATINPVTNIPDDYWVAISEGRAVGSVAMVPIGERSAVLKRMMLRKKFRGRGIAEALLEKALVWAKENEIREIYLGTMTQFKAAQRFYERCGFDHVDSGNLPESFLHNPLDSVFFRMKVK